MPACLHTGSTERLRLLEAADSAGFYAYHLAQHHATPLGMAPSPALFLAAAAQRTRQIRSPTYCRCTTLSGSSRKSACWTTCRAGGWNWASAAAPRPMSLGLRRGHGRYTRSFQRDACCSDIRPDAFEAFLRR
ncbi:LLM class flavin-dependent oxidoreductase [Streptomyces sp. NPDC056069]|uniref:LLM class flavin-dependent oxidoreductase n=1 Tax=Streptomyces sp. NPDC056069 TaxID=3345702 RepID=UPI0035D73A0D